jgi:hypothetical protein
MKTIFYAMIALIGISQAVFAQGTQVLSYGYPVNNYYYATPVVPGVVQYQNVVTGVIIDTTPRVTVIGPILPIVPVVPIVHPVPVVIQPIGPVVHRCWWPNNWRYTY